MDEIRHAQLYFGRDQRSREEDLYIQAENQLRPRGDLLGPTPFFLA